MTAVAESLAPARASASPLALLGSMKLAVVLIVLLALLTWLGTLAQIDEGLWKVQRDYFESWGLIAQLPLSWWGTPLFTLRIPLPGAYPVMGLLFVNLVVGGLMRLRWNVRNIGVLVVHIGIALLLIAGFVKLEASYSGHLALYEAPKDGSGVASRLYEASTFVSFHDYELALLTERGEQVEERVVAEAALANARGGSVTLAPAGLPFKVQLHDWLDNCPPRQKGPMVNAVTPVVSETGSDVAVFLEPRPANKERERNVAGCYVTVLADDGTRIDSVLFGAELRPFEKRRVPFCFTVAGVRYGLDLRRVMFDLPYTVRLDRFEKNDHPGTTMARDFRSFVTVREGAAERQAQIYMNTPLRKDGFVLYQTNWGPQEGGGPPWYSVLEVSNNPSDMWPAIACGVIALGLMIHFLRKLGAFLTSSTREALKA